MSRIWCFTKFSDVSTSTLWCLASDDNLPLDNPDSEKVQCLYYQVEECPTTHRIHLQGFIIMKKRTRFSTVSKLFEGCHITKARGTQDQNIAYCSKSESKIVGPFKIGELLKPGEDNAFKAVCEYVKQGKPISELALDYPDVIVRHSRGLEQLIRYIQPRVETFRHVEVIYIYGPTGTGKTRMCYESQPLLYEVRQNGLWWDGYVDQKCILFDEFYGDIKIKDMLRWLDGYPVYVPFKGGFIQARWTIVYITSNVHPDDIYRCVPIDVKSAFMRRISEIINKT